MHTCTLFDIRQRINAEVQELMPGEYRFLRYFSKAPASSQQESSLKLEEFVGSTEEEEHILIFDEVLKEEGDEELESGQSSVGYSEDDDKVQLQSGNVRRNSPMLRLKSPRSYKLKGVKVCNEQEIKSASENEKERRFFGMPWPRSCPRRQ